MDWRAAAWALAVWGGLAMAGEGSPYKSQQPDTGYVEAMKEVAQKFTGTPGVFLHFGDSITHANQYTQLGRNGQGLSDEEKAFLKWTHAGANNDLDGWHLASVDVPNQRRSETAVGGITAAKYLKGGHGGLPSLEELLKKYNPQLAVYLLGTNDLRKPVPVESYIADVEKAMDLILAHGTIPILSTVPPFRGKAEHVAQYNQALRELAAKKKIPLLDLHAEMSARAGDQIEQAYLGKDGIHLSHEFATGPASDENLARSGYLIRGWMAIQKGMEVKRLVIDAAGKEK